MRTVLALIFLCFTSASLAQTREAQCAQDLCGEAANNKSQILGPWNYGDYLDKPGLEAVQKTTPFIEKLIKKFVKASSALLSSSEVMRPLLQNELNQKQWDELYQEQQAFLSEVDLEQNLGPIASLGSKCDESCQTKVIGVVKKMQQNIPELRRQLEKFNFQRTLSICQANFAEANIKVDPLEKQRAISYIKQEIVPTFVRNAMAKFNVTDRLAFKRIAQNEMEYFLEQENQEGEAQAWKDEFGDLVLELDDAKERLSKLVLLARFHHEGISRPNFQSLLSICDEYPHLNSGAYGDLGISFGYVGLKRPAIINTTIAHELGHALSDMVNRGRLSISGQGVYLRARHCVQSRYDGGPTQSVRFAGDTLTTEEDMADQLSQAAYPEQDKNFCSYLLLREEQTYENPSNSIFGMDDHATPIVRLLQSHVTLGKTLSNVCEQVVQIAGEKINFETCI